MFNGPENPLGTVSIDMAGVPTQFRASLRISNCDPELQFHQLLDPTGIAVPLPKNKGAMAVSQAVLLRKGTMGEDAVPAPREKAGQSWPSK